MAPDDVEDIPVADTWAGNGGAGARIVFGPDGKMYLLTEEDGGALLRIDPDVQ